MNVETIKQYDEILGYSLTRKIGSGGYGDVWEAEAPGGLKKALKVVFGYSDEKRAQAELKALDRIKEARHPFLLSLERIEVVNSKLVIVSELAERSLADLVNEYADHGQTGVPRDELLGYMNDAADALDYLHNTFGLQHLDVKPENILLVSGHAKVADFGLVKDLREATQSLMTGMTPAYAAPELFDGRPGPASDQYSLATVYMEMLTMVRPFSGSTPAQLAAQHMNGKPDLRSVPISDQSVIAKALSKDPTDRYKSCKQFVEQLCVRKSRKRVIKSRATNRQGVDTSSETVCFDNNPSDCHTELFSNSRLTFNKIELVSKGPPECDPAESVYQPTLVVGVGQSSSKVLRKIKERMVARHRDADVLPALGLLCIDSDRDALAKMSIGRDPSMLRVNETLAIPLKRSDQYRQKTKLDLSWISRRWIYNVPRSGQTEGLRPLGRLVFVDHFDAICDKLSASLSEILKEEHIAKTCETLEIDPPEVVKPRIIVVSNISGGLGSGLTNDLAYTVRLMAAEQGIKEIELGGILMYGNEAVGRETELAAANAYSYLSELRHFADGGYPGDPRLGIPEFEDELPFDHVYAVKLRADKDPQSFSDQDKIAEFICLSTTTPCSVFFDASRKQDKQNEEFAFRSFGVSVCGPGLQIQGQDAVERLSKNLIDSWVFEDNEQVFSTSGFANSCIHELKLDIDSATNAALAIVSDMDEWNEACHLADKAISVFAKDSEVLNFGQLRKYFDDILDAPHWRRENVGTSSDFCLAAETEISTEAQLVGDRFSLKILKLLNQGHISFQRLERVVQACFNAVQVEYEKVIAGLHAYGTEMQRMRAELEDTKSKRQDPSNWEVAFIRRYGKLRMQEFALRSCGDQYRVVKSCLCSTEEIIKKFKMQLDSIGQSYHVQPMPKRSAKYSPTIQQMLVDSVDENRREMVQEVERLVLQSIKNNGAEFLEVLSDSVNWQQQLPELIKDAAQSVLSDAFKKISIDTVISKNNIQPAALKSWLNEQLNDATPFVTDCGGSATLLLGQPRLANKSIISNIIQDCFGVRLKEICGTTGDLVICFEADRLLLANLAFSILKEAPSATEIIKRIQSRNDIDWTSLEDLM